VTNYISFENALRVPPYNWLPVLIENHKDREWALLLHPLSKEEKREQFQKAAEKLRREYEPSAPLTFLPLRVNIAHEGA
jgi:hypothetical protein